MSEMSFETVSGRRILNLLDLGETLGFHLKSIELDTQSYNEFATDPNVCLSPKYGATGYVNEKGLELTQMCYGVYFYAIESEERFMTLNFVPFTEEQVAGLDESKKRVEQLLNA